MAGDDKRRMGETGDRKQQTRIRHAYVLKHFSAQVQNTETLIMLQGLIDYSRKVWSPVSELLRRAL